MNTVKITLDLPEDVVQDAQQVDALNSETITQLLRSEIARKVRLNGASGEIDQVERDRLDAMRRFLDIAERMSSIDHGITEEDVKAEIAAVRRGNLM